MVDSARRRVLIVDDEPLVLEILSEHFEIDYDVEIALNGVDALNAVRRQRPDVVLLDVKMPGMSGVEVLKAIKQLDDSIAVIMVTANEQVAIAAEALKSGAFGYVPKPFDFRFLDHTLTAILNRPTRDDTARGTGSV
jgi:DNA-binding response OmpR family regulator